MFLEILSGHVHYKRFFNFHYCIHVEPQYCCSYRCQDIAVARAQHGHTTFVRTSARSAEAYRGVWGHPPPPNFTASQVGSEAIHRSEV